LASLIPARITRDQRDHWLGSAHFRRGQCAEPPKSTSVFAVVTKSGSSSVDGYIAVAVAQGVRAAQTQSLQSAGPPQNPAEMKDRRHGKHAQRNQDCDLQIYPLRLPTPRYQSKSRVARRRESELREFGSGASPSPRRFFRRVILARMRRPKIFDFEPVPQLFDLVVRIRSMPKSGFRWCRLRGLNSRPSVYKTAALPLS
jgi:hypothetical protein